MQEFNQRGEMEMGGRVGGIILYLLPSAIQLACKFPCVFKIENNIGKLVIC